MKKIENLTPAQTAKLAEYTKRWTEIGLSTVPADRPRAEAADDEFIAYVHALAPADITHQRPFDTHETVQLSPGNYEIRRQREYMPEGFRKAQD